MIQYSWLIPAMPALAYALIAIFTRKQKALSAGISILTMATCFLMSVGIFFDLSKMDPANRLVTFGATWLQVQPWQANVGVLIDPLSVNMLLVVTFISLLVQIYSLGYMHDDERFSTYYAYLSLFTSSMLLLVVSNNYLQIFVGVGIGRSLLLLIDRILVLQA